MSESEELELWKASHDGWMRRAKAAEAEVVKLREVLIQGRVIVKMMDFDGRRADAVHAPEDDLVRKLCREVGYGAVMDSAARLWFLEDRHGSFVVGPCAAVARGLFKRIDDALEEVKP